MRWIFRCQTSFRFQLCHFFLYFLNKVWHTFDWQKKIRQIVTSFVIRINVAKKSQKQLEAFFDSKVFTKRMFRNYVIVLHFLRFANFRLSYLLPSNKEIFEQRKLRTIISGDPLRINDREASTYAARDDISRGDYTMLRCRRLRFYWLSKKKLVSNWASIFLPNFLKVLSPK